MPERNIFCFSDTRPGHPFIAGARVDELAERDDAVAIDLAARGQTPGTRQTDPPPHDVLALSMAFQKWAGIRTEEGEDKETMRKGTGGTRMRRSKV